MLQRFVLCVMLVLALSSYAKTVRLSDFKPQRDDATKAFRDAIASGAETIIVDNPGFPLQTDYLKLRDKLEMVFADGVIVEAKAGALKVPGLL